MLFGRVAYFVMFCLLLGFSGAIWADARRYSDRIIVEFSNGQSALNPSGAERVGQLVDRVNSVCNIEHKSSRLAFVYSRRSAAEEVQKSRMSSIANVLTKNSFSREGIFLEIVDDQEFQRRAGRVALEGAMDLAGENFVGIEVECIPK